MKPIKLDQNKAATLSVAYNLLKSECPSYSDLKYIPFLSCCNSIYYIPTDEAKDDELLSFKAIIGCKRILFDEIGNETIKEKISPRYRNIYSIEFLHINDKVSQCELQNLINCCLTDKNDGAVILHTKCRNMFKEWNITVLSKLFGQGYALDNDLVFIRRPDVKMRRIFRKLIKL